MTRQPWPTRRRRWTRRCTACRACSRWPIGTTSSPRSTVRLDQLDAYATAVDAALAEGSADTIDPDALESASAASIRLRDVLWAIRRDRLRTAREVDALAGRGATVPARAGYLAIQQALSAIDRMEVRGRDSAGIHLFVWDHGLDLDDPAVADAIAARAGDPMFQSGSLRVIPHGGSTVLSFVYKAAAEIGELGDNTAAMRAAVADDRLARLAMSGPDAKVSVLGHTRWASVGIISEPNAHPVNSDEDGYVAVRPSKLLASPRAAPGLRP